MTEKKEINPKGWYAGWLSDGPRVGGDRHVVPKRKPVEVAPEPVVEPVKETPPEYWKTR